MNIPIWLIIFFPKKMQEKWIQKKWDIKQDCSVLAAHKDATEWVRLSKGMFAGGVVDEIAADCQAKLDKYILPQMKKRNLTVEDNQ